MAPSVLFVDDDRNLCQIVAKALRGEGYEVLTAFDGESALTQIQEDCPDLLFLDLQLPRKDGFQVLEQIRALSPPLSALPTVLLSSSTTTPAYSKRADGLRAVDLLVKPVALDRLVEIVVSQIGEAKAPGARKTDSRNVPPPRRSTISGQLDRIPFPAVLHHLHGLRATGVLHLETEKKRKWIEYRDGYPVAVRSNLVRETLGHFLERTGRITRTVLEESRQEMETHSRRQGEVLVAMQVLSEERLAEALRDQADEKLFEIFAWEAGRFHFERGSKLERANVLGLGRSPANLILEGVRSRFPISRVDKYLRAHALRAVVHGSSPFYRFQELHVDPNEEALLRSLDGTQPLGAFLREEESTRRTVYAMLAAGLLELQGEPPPAAKPSPAPSLRAEAPRPQPQPHATPAPAKPHATPAPARPQATPAPAKPVQAKPAKPSPKAAEPTPRPEPPRAAPVARSAPPTPTPAPRVPYVPLPPRKADVAKAAGAAVATESPELASLAEKLRAGSYFELLGVPENAGADVVREAYEDLYARVHPDRFLGASQTVRDLAGQVFRRVTEAHETLSDPRKRQEHALDRKRAEREVTRQKQAERALEAATAYRDGEAALRVRDYEGALRWFGKALELYPDEGDHHAHYGWALYLCHPSDPGMVQEALEHVRRGLKLATHREKPFLFMGRLHKAMGQNEVAEKMFTRAVQIQPECVEALRELRLINMRRDKSKSLIGKLLKR